jgi:hypothetical protein
MARAAYRERDAAACMVSVVIRLDEDTHEEIRARAKKEGTSFAEQVRLLVEWGLMADGGGR